MDINQIKITNVRVSLTLSTGHRETVDELLNKYLYQIPIILGGIPYLIIDRNRVKGQEYFENNWNFQLQFVGLTDIVLAKIMEGDDNVN
jgi:hypothetical protein